MSREKEKLGSMFRAKVKVSPLLVSDCQRSRHLVTGAEFSPSIRVKWEAGKGRELLRGGSFSIILNTLTC